MKFPLIITLIACLFSACVSNSEEGLYGLPPAPSPCDSLDVSLANDLRPILLEEGCAGCHTDAVPSGGISLQDHADLIRVVNDGRLLGSLEHQNGFSPMPRGGAKLLPEEIQLFRCWIEQGALNN